MEFKQTYKSRYEPTEEDLKMINYSENGYFLIVSYALIQQLGVIEAVFLQHLISKFSQFIKGGSLVSNQFFIGVENIEHDLKISEHIQRKTVQQLQQMKLIEVRYFGMPKRRYFILNSKNINKALTTKIVSNNNSVVKDVSDLNSQSLKISVTEDFSHSALNLQDQVTENSDILIKNNINNNELSKIKTQLNSLRSFNCERALSEKPNACDVVVLDANGNEIQQGVNEVNAITQIKETKKQNKKKQTFVPPTLEEVQMQAYEYIRLNNYNLNYLEEASGFFSKYDSNGWRDRNNKKIDDWKQTLLCWVRNDSNWFGKNNKTMKNGKPYNTDMNTIEGMSNVCDDAAEKLMQRMKARGL